MVKNVNVWVSSPHPKDGNTIFTIDILKWSGQVLNSRYQIDQTHPPPPSLDDQYMAKSVDLHAF